MRFFDKGLKLFEAEQYLKAAIEFKNAIQIDPKFSEAYYMLGRLEMKNSNYKKAYSHYSKAIQLNPGNLKAHYELGRFFLVAYDPDEAEKKASLILEKDPKNEDGLVLKAAILLARNKLVEAKTLLEKLRSDHVDRPELYLMLARVSADKNGGQAHVEARLKEGLSRHPKDIGLHRALLQLYLSEKNSEKAAALYRKIIDIAPENPDYRVGLADFYWNDKSTQKAVVVLDEMIQLDRKNVDNRLKAAAFYMAKKEMDRAVEAIRGGLEADKKNHLLKIALAEIYRQSNDADKAMALLREVILEQKDPSHAGAVSARTALAKIHLEKKEIDAAKGVLDEVLKDNPKSIQAHHIRGDIFLSKKDGLNAITDFRIVIAEQPEEVLGYIKLAKAHQLNNEKSLAKDTLRNGLKIVPHSREISQALALFLFEEKAFDDLRSHLKDMVQKNPKDMRFRLDLAEFYFNRNELESAADEYRHVIEKLPSSFLAYQRLSQVYSKLEKPEEALMAADKGLQEIPDSKDLFVRKVEVLINRNMLDQAEELCRTYAALHETEAFYPYFFGKVCEFQKKDKEAEALFLKAAELKPTWISPHQSLTNLLLTQGRREEAENRLKKALTEEPKNLPATISLAAIYEENKEYGAAKQVYQQFISQNANGWHAANNLAYLFAEYPETDADYQKALALVKKAYESQPENPMVLDTMGWVHYKLNNFSDADICLRKALSQEPMNQIMKYHMGMVLLKQGRFNDAKRELEAALDEKSAFKGRTEAEKTLKELKEKAAS